MYGTRIFCRDPWIALHSADVFLKWWRSLRITKISRTMLQVGSPLVVRLKGGGYLDKAWLKQVLNRGADGWWCFRKYQDRCNGCEGGGRLQEVDFFKCQVVHAPGYMPQISVKNHMVAVVHQHPTLMEVTYRHPSLRNNWLDSQIEAKKGAFFLLWKEISAGEPRIHVLVSPWMHLYIKLWYLIMSMSEPDTGMMKI